MKSARHLLIGLVLFVLCPAATFGDNSQQSTVWEDNFIPGATDACYGSYCMVCGYVISASKGPQPPECMQIDYPAFCGCTISVNGSDPSQALCENWGKCYYHP